MISILSKNKSNHSAVFIAQSAFPRSLDVKIQLEVEECPPGFFLDTNSKKCKCTPGQFNNLVRCLSNFTALIKKGYWIGKTKYSEKPVLGPCRFCEPSDEHIRGGYVVLPRSYTKINKVLCGENKKGTLCTSCNKEESYALTITGYGCHDCSKSSAEYAWALFIVTQLLPVTAMFFILYFTNFSLASGYLNGAIFFAQTITTSLDISGNGEVPLRNATDASDVLVQVYDVLYSIWNLDFIEPIKYCLAPDLSMNSIFVIQYAVALFPLVFVILIFIYHCCGDSIDLSRFCCLNPLKRCYDMINDRWGKFKNYADIKQEKSLRNVLASCILLAYTRCALNTCYILYPAQLFDASHNIITTVSYFDASTKYGQSTEHLVCVIIAVLVSILFLLPVPVFLFFCRYRNVSHISYFNIILESLQCEFKDGENQENQDNTTHNKATVFQRPSVSCVKNTFLIDLRWVSSLYFTMRIAMTLAYITTSAFIAQVLIQQVLSCIMVTIILVLQPYKERVHNQIDGCIFLLIIIINSITLYQYTLSISMENLSFIAFIIQYILVYLPMIWIAVYIIWRIVKLFKLVKRNKSTYQRMDMANAASREVSTEIPK
uniref:TRP C-terminal domain-containing protein n=1 Tax=Amphimedon queenslandica TaxID=400682 RepID=A0A1X7SS80_AMPQE